MCHLHVQNLFFFKNVQSEWKNEHFQNESDELEMYCDMGEICKEVKEVEEIQTFITRKYILIVSIS